MASPRVVVVGSVNADLVVAVDRLPGPGETVTGGSFARHGGGKGANQAVAAARLGARVTMIGAVGDDDFGAQALDELAAEGVEVDAVARLANFATGVAAIVVDAEGENQIAVASGANARVTAVAVTAALRGRLEGARGAAQPGGPPGAAQPGGPPGAAQPGGRPGAVLLGHEVPDEAVVAGAEAAAAAGWITILNPAPARAIAPAVLATRPLLTPNAAEAIALTGERDPEAAARALAAQSHAAVLVTLGAQGALLLADDAPLRLPAPHVDATDTTGAGDAFNGALAAELAAGRPLVEAARFALAAAALSTRRPGARAGMPRREEVLEAQ